MQGAIFLELKAYADTCFGHGGWSLICQLAKLEPREYALLEDYPDAEAIALVMAASQIAGRAHTELLEDFGKFIAPHLLEMFWGCVDPAWRTLDVIENTEDAIHRVVRLRSPTAKPPRLQVTRPSADQIVIEYRSDRKLCALAKGIVLGLAGHFDECVAIFESQCMLRGDDCCCIAATIER